ncbi:MAG: alpha/beta fold hydrolase [Planctomycetales bacterium]
MRRVRRSLLWLVALGVVFWLVSSAWMVGRLTHRRSPRQELEATPEVPWAVIETLRLKTLDGEDLGGWLTRGPDNSDIVLLLHGNGQTRRAMFPIVRPLAKAGFTTLSITFRAHGDSSGDVNDFGYSNRHDVIAAVNYLEQRFPGRRIFIIGRSLGAAAAIFSAEALGNRIAGYLLEAPYKDLDSATWYRFRTFLPPVLDHAAYWGMRLWAPAYLPVEPGRIAPLGHVSFIPKEASVTMLFGSRDRWAPLEDGREMAAAMLGSVKIVTFEGARHRPLFQSDPDRFETAMFEMLGLGSPLRANLFQNGVPET